MPKAKSPRTLKSKAANTMAEISLEKSNGNGHTMQYSPADLESEIRMRAYELYQQRGNISGQPEEDWLMAEREVLARRSDSKHTV
jgi:hypothetical protein